MGMQNLYLYASRIGIFIIAVLLSGCQTLGSAGLVKSTVTSKLSSEAANAMAKDMVAQLTEHMGRANSTIALATDGSEFGRALEGSLRTSGYAVVTDQKANPLETAMLAYVVDDFEGRVLLRLSTKAVDLTRIYKLSGTGAEPVSPLSVQLREQAIL